MRRLLLSLALLSVPLLVGSAQAAPSVHPEIATVKIRPDTPAKPGGVARIAAARNEFEPFQIVLRSDEAGLRNVRAEATPLVGPEGATIPAEAIWLFRQDYLEIDKPSGSIGRRGRWPDPLIPARDELDGEPRNAFPFDVAPEETRAIWVDVLVPADAPAGIYRGSVEVSADGFESSVPVELEVWDFDLPSTATLQTSFRAWSKSICEVHTGRDDCGGGEQLAELMSRYGRLGLDHRITIPNLWMLRPTPENWDVFDRHFGPLLDGTAPTRLEGAAYTSAELKKKDGVEGLRDFARHFREKGWFDLLYDYSADEPPHGHKWSDIPKRHAVVKEADPEIPVLVTTNIDRAKDNDVAELIDLLVPIINHLDSNTAPYEGDQGWKYEPFVEEGRRVWTYQSCMSHGCSFGGNEDGASWPSYMVDVSAMRNRAMQWANFNLGVTGELYYETALLVHEDPFRSVFAFSGNGDGTLFYPGTPERIGGSTDVPLASLRLKLIREGIEDYEYLSLLSRLGDAELARQLAREVQPKAWQTRDDPAPLMEAREQIARRIVELRREHGESGPAPTSPGFSWPSPRDDGDSSPNIAAPPSETGSEVETPAPGEQGCASAPGGILPFALLGLGALLRRRGE